jgi:hypothetical protein
MPSARNMSSLKSDFPFRNIDLINLEASHDSVYLKRSTTVSSQKSKVPAKTTQTSIYYAMTPIGKGKNTQC